MKAFVYTQYGSPDVLQFKEVEKPTPKEDEVLIKVHAASLTANLWIICFTCLSIIFKLLMFNLCLKLACPTCQAFFHA